MALGFFIFNPQTKRVTHLRIGISGASGFIGQKLLHDFIEQGHHVAVLSRDSRQFKKHPQIEVFEVDLTPAGSVNYCSICKRTRLVLSFSRRVK